MVIAAASICLTLPGVLAGTLMAQGAGDPVSGGLTAAATAHATAVRGEQVAIRPPPKQPACQRVVVIGDSLMANALGLDSALERAGYTSLVDAQPNRQVPDSKLATGGITAALRVRSTWGDADCWVIALGSNDIGFGGGTADAAAARITSMLDAVTPGASVWWMNINYHRDPRSAIDFVGATGRFNAQLVLAGQAGRLTVIDWYSLSEAHPAWFIDSVHVNMGEGSTARIQQVIDALTG